MADHWIAGAVGKHPGAFSAKAKKAGESTSKFASEHASSPGKLGKEARLARTLMGMHHMAEGGVVGTPDQPPSRLSQLWNRLMGKEALQAAAGNAPPSVPPPPQPDTSYVRKAAEEAGKRMEAEKAAQKPK